MAKGSSGIFNVDEPVLSSGIALSENYFAPVSSFVPKSIVRSYTPLSSGKSLCCSKRKSQMSISWILIGGYGDLVAMMVGSEEQLNVST
jgi:hypothetical protein